MSTRINLLPPEYRRKEMTPIAVLLPVLSAVTLVAAAGFFWGWLHFGKLNKAQSEHSELQDVFDSKKPTLAYLQALEREESDYRFRAETIRTIAASRVIWTRKLDELCEVVIDDDNGERYLVWLQDMKVSEPRRRGGPRRGAGPEPGAMVALEGLCFSDSDALRALNNFHEALKQSEFYHGDFIDINNPAGKAVTMKDELRPSKAWTVKLDMAMRGADVKGKGRRSVADRAR